MMRVQVIVAGFVAVLVGFASSVAIVLQAATAAGATTSQMTSWVSVLGFVMGITCLGFSWYYKAPVLTAWSTPGAALLATALSGHSMAQAVGVFMFSGLLTLLLGLSGWFDRLSKWLPLPLAQAMLAGVLLQFGLQLFKVAPDDPLLLALALVLFVVGRLRWPRYNIPLILLASCIWCAWSGQLQVQQLSWQWPAWQWVTPEFSWQACLGIGLPLFIVTMTSQNLPGVAVLKSYHYEVPVSPVLNVTGGLMLLLAPFGNFSLNLAAITAAICAGPEAHPEAAKRYQAGMAAGVFYLLTGLAGASIVTLFLTFPQTLIAVIAGLALVATISANLSAATAEGPYRDAATLTLLMTASGVSLLGVSSAFWGLLVGICTLLLQRVRQV